VFSFFSSCSRIALRQKKQSEGEKSLVGCLSITPYSQKGFLCWCHWDWACVEWDLVGLVTPESLVDEVQPSVFTAVILLLRTTKMIYADKCPLSLQGNWTRQPLKVPSNSNDSMVPRTLCWLWGQVNGTAPFSPANLFTFHPQSQWPHSCGLWGSSI